ncbi:MAG TPA: tetratricopeptide repeat protein [Myxococcota bacterium]|nr:tetratricopeptide repeat protein [Myxococcota bacterium]HQK50465.1 tetratricopeptide repeat protein [Myxococcota bacterium]
MKASRRAWLLWIAVPWWTSCAPRVQQVRMDPMEFVAQRTDEGIAVDLLDPEVLFREGTEAWEARRLEEAARKFGWIVKHFPDTPWARPALYNRALSLLAARRPGEAADDLQAFLQRYPEDEDLPDVLLKAGQALQESGRWSEAEALLRRRLGFPMTLFQEFEARARLARVLRMLGRSSEAREEVQRVLSLADRNATVPTVHGNEFVAMASYEGAETWHDLFSRIRFVLPTERMEKDLEDKATLFLKAQAEYLRTLRLGNVYWSVQAGLRMGRLYEEFYDDLLGAEIPPELNPEEREIYLQELRRKARPLVAKAVATYERNLSLARAYGAREEWLGDLPLRIARLRRILEETPDSSP